MKKSTNSSIYQASEKAVRELYSDYVSGPDAALTCVVSWHTLADEARGAAEKSLKALGYGSQTCFVKLEVDGIALAENDLFLLMEGIDPAAIVACDPPAAEALSRAYRQSVPLDAASRVFGRPLVAFKNLEGMMQSPELKQKAWALFKQTARK